MPQNLELKVAVPDLRPFRRRAAALPGVRAVGPIRQVDRYFSVETGYLKLRTARLGDAELIRYQRSSVGGVRRSDYIRCPVHQPARLSKVLAAAIGSSCIVRKTREVFLYRNARIHLDRVVGLGTFVEIEVRVADTKHHRIKHQITSTKHQVNIKSKKIKCFKSFFVI